ncbi:MAG: hypothetical protein NTW25_15705 [Candidatus Kapabacteria bacterium]|nr:hypothetical protein [Candidatus Kapabacteria bacterium]
MNKAYIVFIVVFLISCNEKRSVSLIKAYNDTVGISLVKDSFLNDSSDNKTYQKSPITADDTIHVSLNGGAYGKSVYYKGNIKRILESYPEFNFK